MNDPILDWFTLFLNCSQALLTPALAVFGCCVAWQQWRTNQNRLRNDLFERRYSIYQSAVDFIGSIMREGKLTGDAQNAFRIGTRGSRFLYGKPVADYLDELWVDAIDLKTHQNVFADLPVGEERTKRVEAAGEIQKKFLKHFGQLDKVVAPYLDMGGIR